MKTTARILMLGAILALAGCGGGNDPSAKASGAGAASGTQGTGSSTETPDPSKDPSKTPEDSPAQGAEVKPAVPGPQASPASQVSKGAVQVTLTAPTPEAKIAYSLNGVPPVPGKSPTYTAPLNINQTSLVIAVAYLPDGRVSAPVYLDYTIGEICVAPGRQGIGTRTNPQGNLRSALDTAARLGINLIKLAPGTFQGIVDISSGITLSGGWLPGFGSPGGNYTVIQGTPMPGDSKKAPAYGLKLAAGSDGAVLERLEILGGSSDYSSGLLVAEGSKAQIRAARLVGGSGAYSYGAVVTGGAAPTFSFTTFEGGTGDSGTGLSVDGARAVLVSCNARAGSGHVTGIGATVTDGSLAAANSVFVGGNANNNYGISLYNVRDTRIESSNIWGGAGKDSCGVFISVGNPVINSSIIAAGGTKTAYGITANYGNSAPAELKNNAYGTCATGIYFHADSRTAYTEVNPQGQFTSKGKVLGNPSTPGSQVLTLTLTPPALRTPAGTPKAVLTGGLPASFGKLDVLGVPRTEPWSIGAFEIDQ